MDINIGPKFAQESKAENGEVKTVYVVGLNMKKFVPETFRCTVSVTNARVAIPVDVWSMLPEEKKHLQRLDMYVSNDAKVIYFDVREDGLFWANIPQISHKTMEAKYRGRYFKCKKLHDHLLKKSIKMPARYFFHYDESTGFLMGKILKED